MILNKDIVVLAVAKTVQVGLALVSLKVLTEILSKDEVGNYYLLLTLLTLFNFAFLNPIGQYYSRKIIYWHRIKNLLNATNILLALRLVLILAALLIAYYIFNIFDYAKYYTKTEFLVFLFVALAAGTHGVLLNAVNLLGNRLMFAKFLLFTLLASLASALIITLYIDRSAIGWLYGYAIAQLIFLIPLYRYVISDQPFDKIKVVAALKPEYIKKTALFIIPISITLFLQWGQNTSYRFVVEAKYSLEALASIGVGIAVATAIFGAVESLATQYYNPIYLRKITDAPKDARAQAWNEMAGYLIPIYLLLTIFVVSLSPHLIKILVSSKFSNAYTYTLIGAFIELFRVLTNIVYAVSQSELNTKLTIAPYAIGFSITICTLFIADFSNFLWMIPIVLSISQAVIFILMFYNMRKLLKINIKLSTITNSFMISTPLFLMLIPKSQDSLMQSLLLTFIGGIYFIATTYFIIQKKL